MTELTRGERRLAVALIALFGALISLPRSLIVMGLVAWTGAPTWGWFAAGMITQTVIEERWTARQIEREGLR